VSLLRAKTIHTLILLSDFHLFFERPPANHSDRWSARPFRHFSTVHPPFELSMDPIATKKEKLRFVENLWSAQALARARHSRNEPRSIPRVLRHDEETGLERAGEMFGRACCYWNVWDRRGWSAGTRKVGRRGDSD